MRALKNDMNTFDSNSTTIINTGAFEQYYTLTSYTARFIRYRNIIGALVLLVFVAVAYSDVYKAYTMNSFSWVAGVVSFLFVLGMMLYTESTILGCSVIIASGIVSYACFNDLNGILMCLLGAIGLEVGISRYFKKSEKNSGKNSEKKKHDSQYNEHTPIRPIKLNMLYTIMLLVMAFTGIIVNAIEIARASFSSGSIQAGFPAALFESSIVVAIGMLPPMVYLLCGLNLDFAVELFLIQSIIHIVTLQIIGTVDIVYFVQICERIVYIAVVAGHRYLVKQSQNNVYRLYD